MQRELPWKLWVVLVLLGLISTVQAAIGIAKPMPSLLIAVVLNVILMVGLYLGHRWAFVVTLLFCVLGMVLGASQDRGGLLISVIHAVLAGGIIGSRRYFWGSRSERLRVNALRCPECSYSLIGLTEPRCPECGLRFEHPR